MTEKQAIDLGDYDWGFSLVDADELDEFQEIQKTVSEVEGTAAGWQEQAEQWKDKAQTIYNAVQPLLKNLAQSPEKEYILWPDRVEKINAFQLRLMAILED